MKKIIMVFIFAIMITVSNTTMSLEAKEKITEEKIQKKYEKQGKQLEKFNKIYSKHKDEDQFKKMFGGAYFESDILYINIVEGYEEEFKTKYKVEETLKTRSVKYSVEKLKNEKSKLDSKVKQLSLVKTLINDDSNSITVVIEQNDHALFEEIKQLLDVENVIIKVQPNTAKFMTRYVTNGDWYDFTDDTQGDCTVGFAAYNSSGDPGFVTAGHCVALTGLSKGSNIYYDYDGKWRHAGDVESWEFDGTKVDAAFIKLRDPLFGQKWLPTQKLIGGSRYDSVSATAVTPSWTPYMAVGTGVEFYGTFDEEGNSISVDYGKITGTNVTSYVEGYTHYDQIETDIVTHHGDSGGPLVYWYYSAYAAPKKYVMGILSAGDNSSSIYTTVDNIYEELNLETYYD